MQPTYSPAKALAHNLVLFGRLLRSAGLDATTGRINDLMAALDHISIREKSDFYHSARCIFANSETELALFEAAFDAFWRLPREGEALLRLPKSSREKAQAIFNSVADEGRTAREQARSQEREEILEVRLRYSERERLRQKDLAALSREELDSVKAMMEAFLWRLGQRRSRRRQGGQEALIDMRRSLRGMVDTGGEMFRWVQRKRKSKVRPLIVLADISGSMEVYSQALLHFVYSLSRHFNRKVEAFVFSTRLTRITRQMQRKDAEAAMQEVSQVVPDWSGGTRIGEALRRFNFEWARRVSIQGAVVLVISDGWDRGDPETLGREIARTQRSCRRLMWLNPLLGSSNYEAMTRGLQSALPHVDDFLPAHNLADLEALARQLSEVRAV